MKENLINYIPLKAYRYCRWLRGEKKIYHYNRKNFSKQYADLCYLLDVKKRRRCAIEEILMVNQAKDKYILDYLSELLGDVVDKYINHERLECTTASNDSRKIWVFWWTGEDNAPDIVKACIKSIRKNSNGHEVVFLDQTNFQNYVHLSETIIEKHEAGIIGHAHFSDIIRLSLLAMYGGMWIDATVFISQPIPVTVFEQPFYTMKTYDANSEFFSKSRWAGYYLSGSSDFPLFSFARDCLVAHWERTDLIIDYLLMDYVFEFAYQNLEEVRLTIDRMCDNNQNRGRLMAEINEPYNEQLFHELATKETFASKLSWRYGNPQSITRDGKLTNYGYLLKL